MATCRVFEPHAPRLAVSFARASAGSSMAARMAMMAITTNSSIKVNAFVLLRTFCRLVFCAATICLFVFIAPVVFHFWTFRLSGQPLFVSMFGFRLLVDFGHPFAQPHPFRFINDLFSRYFVQIK